MQIDLRDLKVGYQRHDTTNPPVHRRKETFITPNYPLYEQFALPDSTKNGAAKTLNPPSALVKVGGKVSEHGVEIRA